MRLPLNEIGEIAMKIALKNLEGIDWDNRPVEARNWRIVHQCTDRSCHTRIDRVPLDALWYWSAH